MKITVTKEFCTTRNGKRNCEAYSCPVALAIRAHTQTDENPEGLIMSVYGNDIVMYGSESPTHETIHYFYPRIVKLFVDTWDSGKSVDRLLPFIFTLRRRIKAKAESY